MRHLRPRSMLRAGLVAAIILASRPAAAQDSGIVSGTVVDGVEQVLPGVAVTLIAEQTGAARATVTDDRGDFAFRAVRPGIYTVRAELSGFRVHERRSNVLNASAHLALGHLKLELGGLNEAVTVVAQGTQVETQNSDYSGLLTSTRATRVSCSSRCA